MVKDKALTEPKIKLEELNIKHAKILDDMESASEKTRAEYLEGIHHKVMERKSKVIAKTHSEAQKRAIKKKRALFGELKQSLLDEVKLATRSEQYESYFKDKVAKTLRSFDVSDHLVFVVNSNDAKFLPEGTSKETDDEVMGGFYVIRNGSEKYDFTLNSEVNALDDYLGCMLNTLYETTGEVCDDEG